METKTPTRGQAAPAGDPQAERQARRLAGPGAWLLALGALLGVPGLLLTILGSDWAFHLGLVLLALSLVPASAGLALVLSAGTERRAGREKPMA